MKETASRDDSVHQEKAEGAIAPAASLQRQVLLVNIVGALAVVPIFFYSPLALMLRDGAALRTLLVRLTVFAAFYLYIPMYLASLFLSTHLMKSSTGGQAALKVALVPICYVAVAVGVAALLL